MAIRRPQIIPGEIRGPVTRRRFLHLAGTGALVLAHGVVPAGRVLAGSSFELGIEGQEAIREKDFARAVRVLEQAVKADPENDWFWGLLGRAYYGLGESGKSVAAFRQALRINPADTYSRMMVERISQRPVERVKKPEAPETPLEREARLEEARMQKTLAADGGLDYRVKRVVIDPGHGGFDPGAVGPSGLKEKDVVLDIAQRLYEKLKRDGRCTPFLTRRGDYYVPLGERTATANQYRADLFVSLHINANEKRSPRGSETYFCQEKASNAEAARVAAFENEVLKYDDPATKETGYQIDVEEILFQFEKRLYWKESGRFAGIFQGRFEKDLPFKSRGVNSANFFVLRRAKMPAILLETGFISNPDNEAMLKDPAVRERIAQAVARGIL